jgi:GAF domain-containing protein/HAMP domain-containing protein
MSWLRNKGLRFKLALGISLTMLISLGLAFFVVSQYIQTQLWERETKAAENLNSVAATLIEDAMMAGRKDIIHDALDNLGQSVGGQIDSIAVYDDQFVLTSFATGFPGGRTISTESLAIDVNDPNCWVCHQLPPEERPTMTVINLEGQEVLRNVVPLYNEPRCQSCHGTGATVLGDSIVDVQLSNYQTTVATVTIGFGIAIAATIIFVTLVLYQLLRRIVISPVDSMVGVTHSVVQGNLAQRVEIRSQDEIGQLGTSFNTMTEQFSNLLEELEQRVANRTRSLEERTTYLEGSANVSRTATTVLDPNQLLTQVVELIRETFNLYYVGIFLVDDNKEWAILQAGTGEAGQIMLDQDHRIKIGEGMIGWCVENNQSRIALDVGMDAVRFENPVLPETRSEGALPLRSRGRVLGAITVQSSEPSAFDQDNLTVLQTMADQITVAIENTRLYANIQDSLDATQRAYGEMSQTAWQTKLSGQALGFRINSSGINSISEAPIPSGSDNGNDNLSLNIPIEVRGQVIGYLQADKNEIAEEWTPEEAELMQEFTSRLEEALESARLYEDTQIQANNERMIGEISTHMRETLDVETVLQTAARELRSVLNLAEVEIRMGNSPSDVSKKQD